MVTSRRSIRSAVALLVVVMGVLALGACTPSELELEERTTRSAYRALTGHSASAKPTCSLKLVGEEAGQDRYEGSCVVHGQSFRMTSFYSKGSASYRTAFTSAAVADFGHTCLWDKNGGEPWKTTSPCR